MRIAEMVCDCLLLMISVIFMCITFGGTRGLRGKSPEKKAAKYLVQVVEIQLLSLLG